MEKLKWDIFIRVFHWATAALFLANYFVLEEGETLHEWAGYLLFLLIIARVIWGFTGSANARFASFFPTPKRIHHAVHNFEYTVKSQQGHNAIGGLMIIYLLTMITGTAITGWMQGLDAFWGEDWVEETHEIFAKLTLAGVGIHIIAILLIQTVYKIPLVKPMISGK